MEEAQGVKWIRDRFIGNFVVSSACGAVPDALLLLRRELVTKEAGVH
jgi:hypothetical protein